MIKLEIMNDYSNAFDCEKGFRTLDEASDFMRDNSDVTMGERRDVEVYRQFANLEKVFEGEGQFLDIDGGQIKIVLTPSIRDGVYRIWSYEKLD